MKRPSSDPPAATVPVPRALGSVALLLAAATLAFHGGSLARVGFSSDSWHLFEIARKGVLDAAKTVLAYHISPVSWAFLSLQEKLFGDSERAWQAANVAGIWLCGVALYLFAVRLLDRRLPALAAAVAFVASAGPYEIALWPLVGNFQALGVLLYLAGMGLAVDAARRERRRVGAGIAFGVLSLAAIFTYEPMVSLVFAGALAFFLLGPGGAPPRFADALRRGVPFWTGGGLALFVLLVVKGRAAASGHQALFLPEMGRDLLLRVFWFERSFLSLFSLRGSADLLHRFFTFGTNAEFGTPIFVASAAAWGVILAALAVGVLRKALHGPVGFLVAWLVGHLLIVAVATSPVSRHFFLPQAPAAILLSLALVAAGDRLARRLADRGDGTAAAVAPAVCVLLPLVLLGAGARRDLAAGADLFADATRLATGVRTALATRLASGVPPSQVVFVNLPAQRQQSGLVAFLYPNCTVPIALFVSDGKVGASQIRFVRTYGPAAPGVFAHEAPEIPLTELYDLVANPSVLVLRHDPVADRLEELDPSTFPVPAEWTSASAPWLDWRPGSFPWMPIAANRPFAAPIDLGEGPAHLALRALASPRTGFRLLVDGEERLKVGPAPTEGWPTSVVVLPPRTPGRRLARVEIVPDPEIWIAGLWGFEAPTFVDPESAPFLSWILRPEPAIVVGGPLEVPLARPEGGAGLLRILHLAEPGRDFDLEAPGIPPVPFRFADRKAPAWVEFEVVLPAGPDPAVLSVRPLGPQPPFLRNISLVAPRVETPVAPSGSRRIDAPPRRKGNP